MGEKKCAQCGAKFNSQNPNHICCSFNCDIEKENSDKKQKRNSDDEGLQKV